MPTQIERWEIFELTLTGPSDGNPFYEVTLSASFHFKHRTITVDGFYDGEGNYKIRFMPDSVGSWHYTTHSNRPELDGQQGMFECVAASPNNHGPVRVHHTYHFIYEDGTPYYPVGTTCYVWNHQGEDLEEQTLETLKTAPFNKMRMCVFPKHYLFNQNEPEFYPFEKAADGWDFRRYCPAFFQHLEKRIGDLRAQGIEADLILFHPYDRWGYAEMPPEVDDHYLRYLVARLAAYRNIWWSFANEYDLMTAKSMSDWDRFFHIVQAADPYQHLRSIHNCREFYDHGKPWVTHCSIQHRDLKRVNEWRALYKKPVVVDECVYEGNIHRGWGNIPGWEMSNRFWEGFVRGGYVGHGETYVHPQDILWWSKGGVLHGDSPARIAFLRQILEESPPGGLDPFLDRWDMADAGQPGQYYLFYFGISQPKYRTFDLPEEGKFALDVIDTWEMTITPLEGVHSGSTKVDLPGKPFIAVRARQVG